MRYRFGRLIHGGAYFRNFTVLNFQNKLKTHLISQSRSFLEWGKGFAWLNKTKAVKGVKTSKLSQSEQAKRFVKFNAEGMYFLRPKISF